MASQSKLPQLTSSNLFVTEGGIETTLIYRNNLDLPSFSTLPLLNTEDGRQTISSIYQEYVNIALAHSTGVVLETRTWRGSPLWSPEIGLSIPQILDLNRTAVKILHDIRNKTPSTSVVISGALGPLQDAYQDSTGTVSFVDRLTENYTTYFGVNCAHPRYIIKAVRGMHTDVRSRIGSIRGNSSLKSHDELDNSLVLDRGDISVWVREFNELLNMLPGLKVVGGCCGTDEEHIDAIASRINSVG
ncbi:Pc16g00430 [Penicillium rubens Wisconsin 54-1255]|uniref:Pc16g00430 protein n=1 Tax=Penicillium rubens (strain ATCC 28089 / DSM 1075 / NRRL 1951 / Wisconsin 54-1255) TaxID=500485 RepID=B6H6V4_PENRW|nr:Pc16g00430 [Penicillium rubens Wisconsin 54-1255]